MNRKINILFLLATIFLLPHNLLADKPIHISNLSFSSINVKQDDSIAVLLNLRLREDVQIREIRINYLYPKNTTLHDVTTLISNESKSAYKGLINIPEYCASGNLRLQSLYIHYSRKHWWYERVPETLIIEYGETLGTFRFRYDISVTNTSGNEDTRPPTIQDVSIVYPESLRVGATVLVKARIEDDISGISGNGLYVEYTNPENIDDRFNIVLSETQGLSKNSETKYYEAYIPVDSETLMIHGIHVSDNASNLSEFYLNTTIKVNR